MGSAPSRTFAFALASIALIGPLAVHLFLPMIPAVKAALGISDALAQLTFSVALFGMAFATLFYGSLSDRFGRRPVLLAGLCLFLLGSVISALATGVATLVLGRLVQAIGAGCGTTLVRAIARDAYGQERLIKAIAYLSMFYTLGPMISPVVGGLLIDTLGWRSVFAFALLAGGLITAGAYFAIPETRSREIAHKEGANGAPMLRSFFQLFSHVRFSAFVLQTGFSTGTFLVIASASSTFMKESLHRSSAEFGLFFLLFPAGFFFGNMLTTRIGNRGATETMVLLGSLMSLAAVTVQSVLLLRGYMAPPVFFLPAFFVTLAQGIALPYGQAGAMATIPHLSGTAAGVGVFVQFFCGAVFSQLYGLFADGTIGPMVVTTALSAVLGLIAGAVPFVLRHRTR
jgi:DHA1 family bicyclomycin/chloramphenicol resistance-like MFS transporter